MRHFLCLCFVCSLLLACEERSPALQPPLPLTDEARSLSTSLNAFAVDLYCQCIREESGNLFLSPCSVDIALTMTMAGAVGDTEYQMYHALRWPIDAAVGRPAYGSELHRHLGILQSHMQSIGDGRSLTLHLASAIWPRKGEPLDAVFVDRLWRNYGAQVTPVDFPQPGCDQINRWVEQQTAKKIRELLKPEMLDPQDTALVLTNAIYFKGDWENQFDRKHTRQAVFHLDAERKTMADMMRQTHNFPYAKADGFAAIELPYRGGAVSMIILLPDRTDGLVDLEQKLNPVMLSNALGQMHERKVAVQLPRFWMTWERSLNEPLKAMGMELAFKPVEADFGGINLQGDLFISRVQHKAFIEVNEEGSEAAAATGVVVDAAADVDLAEFTADHPFLFLIRDTDSGTILFIGRVIDPSH